MSIVRGHVDMQLHELSTLMDEKGVSKFGNSRKLYIDHVHMSLTIDVMFI